MTNYRNSLALFAAAAVVAFIFAAITTLNRVDTRQAGNGPPPGTIGLAHPHPPLEKGARSATADTAEPIACRVRPRAQSMHTHCVPCMPIARAAPEDRSSTTPRVNGPRSFMTTVTDEPFCGFVTVTRDPKGSVRCAAVISPDESACPLAVRRPET